MAGIATKLLPGDAELARRAAGGDGAAFVHLYDSYSAEVFEASLAATGEVEIAADATQSAFLKLLRRPPAMGAPDGEIAERLHALALGAVAEGAMLTRTERGTHAPADAGVGWLRSETVAKAAARFDDDWRPHLSEPPGRPPVERVVVERPLVVPAPAKPAVVANPLPPLAATPKPPARARSRPAWRALPSPAAVPALLLLALFAGAVGVVLTSGGDGGERVKRNATAAAKTQPRTQAAGARRDQPGNRRRAARARRNGGSSVLRLGAAERAFGSERGSVRFSRSRGSSRPTTGGAHLLASTLPDSGGQQTISPVGGRTPTTVAAPEQTVPTTAPAPTQQTTAPTTQRGPPEHADGGESRSCNSKNATDC